MKIVLDTNVVVAALRSRTGALNLLLRRVARKEIDATASTSLILEYESVLLRPGKVPGYTAREIAEFLDSLCSVVSETFIYFRWRPFLPEPKDDLVLECAVAGGASHIVTFNQKDFQGLGPFGISVMTPPEFLRNLAP